MKSLMKSHLALADARTAVESLEPRLLLSGGSESVFSDLPNLQTSPMTARSARKSHALRASKSPQYALSPFTTTYLYTTLDDPNAVGSTQANGISGSTIVGEYTDSSDNIHGFSYNGTTYTTLDDPNADQSGIDDGTIATGIASATLGTTIVGYYTDTSDNVHGFSYDGTTYTTLDDPNADQSGNGDGTYAFGISGSTIVGYYVDISGNTHGFTLTGGVYTTLDDPNGVGNTFATGISGSDIVGYYVDGSGNTHGFLYNGTTYTTLDDPNGVGNTFAIGISGADIVGYYTDSNDNVHGFLYNGTTYTTLDDPNADQSGSGDGTNATGISGTTIVGYYTDSGGDVHGFSATPHHTSTPPSTAGIISGTVFNDHKGDGIYKASRDGGIEYVTVSLQQYKHDKPYRQAETTLSRRNGAYSFVGVLPGTYRVSETPPFHENLTAPPGGFYTITLAANQGSANNNFGNKPIKPHVAIVVSPTERPGNSNATPSVTAVAHLSTPFATAASPETFAASATDAPLLLSANPTQSDVFAD